MFSIVTLALKSNCKMNKKSIVKTGRICKYTELTDKIRNDIHCDVFYSIHEY